MKTGLGFVLLWIHVLALSVGAQEVAEHWNWSPAGLVAAWLIGGISGLIPLVRSLVLFGILASLVPWWQAALMTPPLAFGLLIVSKFGATLLARPASAP